MKKIVSLLTLCALILSAQATDYTIEPTTAIKSTTLPVFINSATLVGSITQQILLAEELDGASAGDITAISFNYGLRSDKTSVASMTRSIQIWLMEVPSSGASKVDSFEIVRPNTEWVSLFLCNENGKAGTKVYDGNLTTSAISSSDYSEKKVTLPLSTSFSWDGSSNIVMTVIDMSETTVGDDAKTNLQFYISQTSHPRFAHKTWLNGSDDTRADMINDLRGQYCIPYGTNTQAKQISGRSYVPKTTFTIVAPTPAPTNLAASNITTNSATLSWEAATGATSYNVRWGKTSGSLDNSEEGVTATSLAIDDLEDDVTYYFDVQTVTSGGESAWTDEASFNTYAIPHIHNDITFSKWPSTLPLPTSGDYYLNDDVTLGAQFTLSGDLNLCLNGHDFNTGTYNIVIPDGSTFAIFDNVGSGRIYGYFESASGTPNGIITIQEGGTLVIHEGAVQNLNTTPNDSHEAYAIYNGGTLRISGNPIISAATADIYLFSNKIITLDGKLTNSSSNKYSVTTPGQTITSGWSTYMSDKKPSDHFISAKSGYNGICVADGEAKLVKLLTLNDNSNNEDIDDGTYAGLICASLNRSFTSASFNTICLPFALSDAQLTDIFGSDYYLAEFHHSELNGEELYLEFYRQEELVAGKPYLIQPKHDVTNPTFEGVTITASSPSSQTTDTYISVHGTYAPTELEGNNKNLLFLGANNTLYWPSSTGNIKGFRAYFEVKGSAMGVARRASIVRAPQTATGISDTNTETNPATRKFIQNGELIIECNGVRYNTLGQPLTR